MKKQQENKPNCHHCEYFYITHEPTHPNGCRAMNFKSRQSPALVVFSHSGLKCQLFSPKKKHS